MRYWTVVTAIGLTVTLTACGPETAPIEPLDAVFNAQGMSSADGCDQPPPATFSRYTVDFLQRPDGLMEVMVIGDWTPGPHRFTAVVRRDGQIDHTEAAKGLTDGSTHKLVGHADLDRLELSLTSEYPNAYGTACRYDLALKGQLRPLHDDKNLEGWYRLHARAYAYTCDLNNPGAPVFDAYTIADLDPENSNGLGRIGLVDGFHFSFSLPNKEGLTGWYGPVHVAQGGAMIEYLGQMNGTLKPNRLEMKMLVTGPDTPDGCGVLYRFKGQKVMPTANGPDGQYRVRLDQSGTCFGEYSEERRYGTTTAVSQPDGSVVLYLEGSRIVLKPKDGAYHGQLIRRFTGGQVNYEVKFEDVGLELTAVLDEETFLGKCAYTIKASGQKRFLKPDTEDE